MKFLYYVVKTIKANKITILISIILKSAILFVQVINKKTKRKTIEATINCLTQTSRMQSTLIITKKSVI
jgi:hypothetical protein